MNFFHLLFLHNYCVYLCTAVTRTIVLNFVSIDTYELRLHINTCDNFYPLIFILFSSCHDMVKLNFSIHAATHLDADRVISEARNHFIQRVVWDYFVVIRLEVAIVIESRLMFLYLACN